MGSHFIVIFDITCFSILKFAIPHTRGSGHGQSRIIANASLKWPYDRMAIAATRKWREIEHNSKQSLLK